MWIKTSKYSNKNIGDKAGHKSKNTGYISITIDRKFNAAHRLAFLYMTGSYPNDCVDHINRDRADNRWVNLRDVTNAENRKNCCLSVKNKSGVSGVYIDKPSGKWEVKFGYNKVKRYFGRYKTLEEAIQVRNKEIKNFDFSDGHGT